MRDALLIASSGSASAAVVGKHHHHHHHHQHQHKAAVNASSTATSAASAGGASACVHVSATACWRPMHAGDLSTVIRIADVVHVDTPEAPEIFAERLALFPAGCYVLQTEHGVQGYILSHPWRKAAPPKLDTLLQRLPQPADTYYIHDIALLPTARGGGCAGAVLRRLVALAGELQLPFMTLISVHGTQQFWERFGFAPGDARDGGDDSRAEAILKSYTAEALLMHRHNRA